MASVSLIPTLLQLSAWEVNNSLTSRQYNPDSIDLLEKLPPNLKDLIRKLFLRRCQSKGQIIEPFFSLLLHDKIKHLDLSDVTLPEVTQLAKIAGPNLKYLNLKRSLKRTKSNEIKEILAKFMALESLHLQHNADIVTDDILSTVATSCPLIRHLDVAHCSALTDEGIVSLRGLRTLSNLNLSHTKAYMSVEWVSFFSMQCGKKLHLINAHVLSKVTDDGIERLLAGNVYLSHSLIELRLDNCPQITDYGVEIVLEACGKHRLNIFLFHGCPRTTERAVMALQSTLLDRKDVKQTTWTIY